MTQAAPQLPEQIHQLLARLCAEISALPWVDKIVLYGSHAKGCYTVNSDLDIAVFAQKGAVCDLQKYRQLARICRTDIMDVQVQVFSVEELEDACGIVEEILEFGIEITPLRCG